MRIATLPVGTIHMVGIGGIGMSGMADVLCAMGHRVQGSDAGYNTHCTRLEKKGIRVFKGHEAAHVAGAAIIVISSAVDSNNPEVVAAREQGIPIIRRAEMLAEILRFHQTVAISGTHGKTTTTSMVAALFVEADLDPLVINGGIINAYGSNTRLGEGKWAVVEADESDGTFVRIPATIAVVTNIDPEHLAYYGDFGTLKEAFFTFMKSVPFYGFSVLCWDHPVVRDLGDQIIERRMISYGFHVDAQVRGKNIKQTDAGTIFDVVFRGGEPESNTIMEGVHLPVFGHHNVLNALSAVAVGWGMGLSPDVIRQALHSFSGVKRRFTRVADVQGVTIIDDYGHHPVEIEAVLGSARTLTAGRVYAVVQPHRYSRLKDLFIEFAHCFSAADHLYLMPVYSAGEEPIVGVDHKVLAQEVQLSTPTLEVETIDSLDELVQKIRPILRAGDHVIFLGAGDITQWAYTFADQLAHHKLSAQASV